MTVGIVNQVERGLAGTDTSGRRPRRFFFRDFSLPFLSSTGNPQQEVEGRRRSDTIQEMSSDTRDKILRGYRYVRLAQEVYHALQSGRTPDGNVTVWWSSLLGLLSSSQIHKYMAKERRAITKVHRRIYRWTSGRIDTMLPLGLSK